MAKTPTSRQLEVLRFIVEHLKAHGLAPTLRELCGRFDWSSTGAAAHNLNALKARGLLANSLGCGASRDMVVTPAGWAALGERAPAEELSRLRDGVRDALALLESGEFEGAANLVRQLAQGLPPPSLSAGGRP